MGNILHIIKKEALKDIGILWKISNYNLATPEHPLNQLWDPAWQKISLASKSTVSDQIDIEKGTNWSENVATLQHKLRATSLGKAEQLRFSRITC